MIKTSRLLICFGALTLATLTPVSSFAALIPQKAKQHAKTLQPQKQLPRPNVKPFLEKQKAIHAKSRYHNKKSSSSHNKKPCCKPVVAISEHDINKASQSSSSGLVLRKPGKYKLCEDVNWKGSASESYAITIMGNNISLDLDGHFIMQDDTSLSNNFAIHIAEGAEDILVHNGIIMQFSGGAILVEQACNCLTFDQLTCNHCTYAGETSISSIVPGFDHFSSTILFNGILDDPIEHVVMTNCSFCDNGILGTAPVSFLGTISGTTLTLDTPPLYPLTPGFVLSGASIIGTPTIVSGSGTVYTISSPQTVNVPEALTVSDPNGQFVPFGFVATLFAAYTNDMKVDNIVINGTFGYLLSWAITLSGGSGIVLTNYEINDTVAFGLAKGVEIADCQNILMEDGAITNITMNVIPESNAFPLAHGAEGTKIGFSQDWTMRRVSFAGNVVQTQVPTDITVSPVAYLDCAGFIVDALAGVSVNGGFVQDCSVIGLRNDGGQVATNPTYTAGYNFATGLGTDKVENIQIAHSIASDLIGSVGFVYGFGGSPVRSFQTNMQDIRYTDCVAQDISGTDDAIYSAGFALVDQRFNVLDCTANRILGDAAYGVVLDKLSSNEATGCIVRNNLLTNCDTGAIIDLTTAKNAVITGNYAALNGPGDAGPNYIGLNPFVPISLWTPYLTSPAPTPTLLDNIDIQN